MKVTLQHLRDLAVDLQEVLGSYWTVKVYSQKECAEMGWRDPACALVKARCALGCVDVDIDGEIDVDSASEMSAGFISPEDYRESSGWRAAVVRHVKFMLQVEDDDGEE